MLSNKFKYKKWGHCKMFKSLWNVMFNKKSHLKKKNPKVWGIILYFQMCQEERFLWWIQTSSSRGKKKIKKSFKTDQMHRSKSILFSSVQQPAEHPPVHPTFFSSTHTLAYFPPTQHQGSTLNGASWCPRGTHRGQPANLLQEQTSKTTRSHFNFHHIIVVSRNLFPLVYVSVSLHHDHTHALLTYRCFLSTVSSAKWTFKASQ